MPTSFVVVTGCTQGLGYHAVREILKATPADTRVVMACRNVVGARAAAATLARDGGADLARLVVLDEPLVLTDLAAVRAFARALRAHLVSVGAPHGITTIVNNAGLGGRATHGTSAQGFEEIFATNHLGHFLLTLLLLPASAAAGGTHPLRIVNVSSEVHDPANKAPLPDPSQSWPTSEEAYDRVLARGEALPGEDDRTSGGRRYSRSKLCNVLFTNELARRMNGAAPFGVSDEGVAALATIPGAASCSLPGAATTEVLAFNPGLMLDTGFFSAMMGRGAGTLMRLLTPILRFTSMGAFLRSGVGSGRELAMVATGPLGAPSTAAYYDGPSIKATSEFSRSLAAVTRYQQELWAHSVRWSGIDAAELAEAGFGAEPGA